MKNVKWWTVDTWIECGDYVCSFTHNLVNGIFFLLQKKTNLFIYLFSRIFFYICIQTDTTKTVWYFFSRFYSHGMKREWKKNIIIWSVSSPVWLTIIRSSQKSVCYTKKRWRAKIKYSKHIHEAEVDISTRCGSFRFKCFVKCFFLIKYTHL